MLRCGATANTARARSALVQHRFQSSASTATYQYKTSHQLGESCGSAPGVVYRGRLKGRTWRARSPEREPFGFLAESGPPWLGFRRTLVLQARILVARPGFEQAEPARGIKSGISELAEGSSTWRHWQNPVWEPDQSWQDWGHGRSNPRKSHHPSTAIRGSVKCAGTCPDARRAMRLPPPARLPRRMVWAPRGVPPSRPGASHSPEALRHPNTNAEQKRCRAWHRASQKHVRRMLAKWLPAGLPLGKAFVE